MHKFLQKKISGLYRPLIALQKTAIILIIFSLLGVRFYAPQYAAYSRATATLIAGMPSYVVS